MNSIKRTTTLLLTLALCTACTNKPQDFSLQPTTADVSSEEQAYYDACSTNPNCSAYHMVPLGAKAETQGILVTEEDEKMQKLLDAAIIHYENYSAQFASDRNNFLTSYVPEYYPELAVGEALAYDDQYLYILMSTETSIKGGELALQGGGFNIPYRFEYDPETLEITNFHMAGEGQERLENMFPEEVIELSHQQKVREDWEEVLKARAKFSDK